LSRILVACSLALAPLLHAAGPGIVGAWHGQSEGHDIDLELNADATGHYNGQPLRYEIMGRQLVVEMYDRIHSYSFERKGDQLTIGGGDLAQPLHLKRSSPTRHAPATLGSSGTASPDLVGKWCYLANFAASSGGGSQTSECFVLHADGRYEFGTERSASAYGGGAYGATASQSSDTGRWTATEGSITAHSNAGPTNTYLLRRQNHPKNREPMICLNDRCYVTFFKKAPW
jgi:hypothetical protein